MTVGYYQGLPVGMYAGYPVGGYNVFADPMKSILDFTGSFPSGINFTRSSDAWYTNDAGVITSAGGNNIPRIDYASGSALGFLCESTKTNLCTYSVPTSGQWSTAGMSAFNFNTSDFVAPDGTYTSGKATPNTVSTQHYIRCGDTAPVSFTSGTTYTLSVYIKPTIDTRTQLFLPSAVFTSSPYANLSLSGNGAVFVASNCTAKVINVGGGWYRCSITATANATATGALGVSWIASDTDTRAPTITPAGTEIFYFWGAQVETFPVASSYIATNGSAVARNGDSATIDLASYPSLIPSDNYVVLVEFMLEGLMGQTQAIFEVNDGTANNRVRMWGTGGGLCQLTISNAATNVVDMSLGSLTAETVYKFAARVQSNNVNGALNGVLGTVDTSCAIPAGLTTALIGRSISIGFALNGWIKRVTIFKDPTVDLVSITS